MEVLTIKCPACGKNNTIQSTDRGALCKRCQADLTALLNIQHTAAQLRVQLMAHLKSGNIQQAQSTLHTIRQLTPTSNDEPLARFLNMVKPYSWQDEKQR